MWLEGSEERKRKRRVRGKKTERGTIGGKVKPIDVRI